jgi:hypothetical protein
MIDIPLLKKAQRFKQNERLNLFMIISEKFLDDIGRRSPIARAAMVQAGDKIRVKALKDALVSIGACEITKNDVEMLNLTIYQKKYVFLASPIIFAFLDKETFKHFKPLRNGVALEIAHARNSLIGILRRQK